MLYNMTELHSPLFPPVIRYTGLLLLCLTCFVAGRVADEFSKAATVHEIAREISEFDQQITRVMKAVHSDFSQVVKQHADNLNSNSPTPEELQTQLVSFQQMIGARNPFRNNYPNASRIGELKNFTMNEQPVNFELMLVFKKPPDQEGPLKFENIFKRYQLELNTFETHDPHAKRLIQLNHRESSSVTKNNKGVQLAYNEFDSSWLIKSNSKEFPQAAFIRLTSEYDSRTKRYKLKISTKEFDL